MVLEQIVACNHVLHASAMQFGDKAQPNGQLVGAKMVLHARFHAYVERERSYTCNKLMQIICFGRFYISLHTKKKVYFVEFKRVQPY